MIRAIFHYTDTDTDFFAAKRTRTDPTEFRRKKVRVRVVEFSSYSTTCADFVRVRVRVVEFSYKLARTQHAN